MKVRGLLILFAVITIVGYIYLSSQKNEHFLDINSKIPVYQYKFELPKQPEIPRLELSPVDPVALQAQSVQFKRTDPDAFLKNMCTYRQQNKDNNSIVGIEQRPISSGNPQLFTDF